MEPSIEDLVLAPLRRGEGHTLRSVTYWPLRGELAGLPLEPPVYLGGEVALDFGVEFPLIITWDENAGWKDHFSLQVRTDSAFKSGTLEELPASHLQPWSQLVGTALQSWRILAANGTPHVVHLTFARGQVFVGDGYQNSFGDGDDVLVALDAGSFNGIAITASGDE